MKNFLKVMLVCSLLVFCTACNKQDNTNVVETTINGVVTTAVSEDVSMIETTVSEGIDDMVVEPLDEGASEEPTVSEDIDDMVIEPLDEGVTEEPSAVEEVKVENGISSTVGGLDHELIEVEFEDFYGEIERLDPLYTTKIGIFKYNDKTFNVTDIDNDANIVSEDREDLIYLVYSDNDYEIWGTANRPYYLIVKDVTNNTYNLFEKSYYTESCSIVHYDDVVELSVVSDFERRGDRLYITTPYLMGGPMGHSSGMSYITKVDGKLKLVVAINPDD